MTWQVSPEEWLLDFTAIPRGRARGGESLDIIDDRLRAMLAPATPPTGVVIPSITAARGPGKPPPVRAAGEGEGEGRPGLDVQLLPVSGPAPIPPPPESGASVVIPSLTRPGSPHEEGDVDLDDDTEALERLSPEMGIPRDDAEDVMAAVAASAPVDAGSDDVEVHEDEDEIETDVETEADEDETDVEVHEDEHEEVVEIPVARAVEKTSPKLAEKPAPPRPPSTDKPIPAPPRPPTAAEKPAAKAPEKPAAPPPVAADKAGPPRPPPAPAPEKTGPHPSAADKAGPPRPPPDKASPPRPPTAAPGRPDPKKRRAWHEEAFGDFFPAILPGDSDLSAELDVAFVKRSLELGQGLTLLDVGCGDGRHAVAFAAAGLDVTGLDCAMPQLLRAARRNEASRYNFDLLHGDMRALPRDRQYDLVTCLGSTLGYFDSDEQNRQCLQDMVDVLKPGGKLVLHVFNRDYLMSVLPCRSWWQGRGCLVLDVADMNFFMNRVRIHRTVVFEDGRQFEHLISIRAYTVHDLGKLLGQMGARVLEVSGGRDTPGRFYGAASPDIWMFAQRRDDA